MSNPDEIKPPEVIPPASVPSGEPVPAAITPVETAHSPVTRVAKPKPVLIAVVTETPAPKVEKEEDRRDFFNDAMREALGPLSGMLERKLNPFLRALEALPDDVERFTSVTLPVISRTLDQPDLLLGDGHQPPEPEPEVIPLPILRPPGALPPGEFESLCSRCGKCVEVCPANAIKLDFKMLIGDGLPYILAREASCVVCTKLSCMAECPTGALKLVDRLEINMGTAKVDHDICLRDSGEDCRLCVQACPLTGEEAGGGPDAIAIHANTGRVVVRKNICVGCGLCENRCPTEPAAIRVVPHRPLDPIIA